MQKPTLDFKFDQYDNFHITACSLYSDCHVVLVTLQVRITKNGKVSDFKTHSTPNIDLRLEGLESVTGRVQALMGLLGISLIHTNMTKELIVLAVRAVEKHRAELTEWEKSQ